MSAKGQKRTHAAQQKSRYSITSSAAFNKPSGTLRPSALAVWRLITSTYLFGACTGKSPGFSPLKMRSTYSAAWRCLFDHISAVGDEASGSTIPIDRGQFVPGRQCGDQIAVNKGSRSGRYDHAAVWGLCESLNGRFNFACVAHINCDYFQTDRWRQSLDNSKLTNSSGGRRIARNRRARDTGGNLFKQFRPFSAQCVFEQHKTGGVTARPSETIDNAGTHWISNHCEYDGHSAGRLV